MITRAQNPNVKVDLNMEGRKESEVNEPGYIPWYVARIHSATMTASGIEFSLVATAPGSNTTFRASWSKALVQAPHYARLVNDGVKIDNDILLANPGKGADMELHISGLSEGRHTIQTYHNVWQDTSETNYCPINLYLNDSLVHSNIQRSIQATRSTDATILFTELNVEQAGQEMVIRIESVKDFVANEGKTTDLNVCINAFELNSVDASMQAREPMPLDADMHVDADSGFFVLRWEPAINGKVRNHSLYFGTDSAGVASATDTMAHLYKGEFLLEERAYRVDSLYSMNTYYWRVDQTDSTGLTTQGNVWSFRPRHLAFRGAEGYGRFATGGRGGKVVEVTNLNDDGPGSFREAITNEIGPRTIVFSVSGMITLESRLVLKSRNVTIAGQTAPGKGICIRQAPLGLGSESITRFIRVRLGAGATYDGMGMAGNNHSIIDHCSVSWTIDEAFSSRNGRNLTLQRTLISEALNIAGHSNYPEGSAHGFAASIGGDVGSFHHNLLAHCNGRNWSLAGGLDGDGFYAGRLDIFNNVVYNWKDRTTDGGAHQVNFVNNFYKKGAATYQYNMLNAQLEGKGKGTQSYYYSGNILQNKNGVYACDGSDNSCARIITRDPSQVVNWQVFVDAPFFPSHATIETASDAYKSVLSDVGCNMPLFDDHDQRIIQETLTGTYTYMGSKSKLGGIIDHQNDAGGYEDYPAYIRSDDFDTDHDGLPDWWEDLHGRSPNSAPGDFSDSNADPDRDGYTKLEEYLEWMSVPHFYMEENVSDTIELSPYTIAYADPVYSLDSISNFDLSITGSILVIRPHPGSHGITYLPIKALDISGSSLIRVIGICVGAKEPLNIVVEQPLKVPLIRTEVSCSVYPSMFDTHLNIELSSDHTATVSATLYDLSGTACLHDDFTVQQGDNRLLLECPPSLSKQMYLLRIVDRISGRILKVERVVKI